jgi:hypothetical protein
MAEALLDKKSWYYGIIGAAPAAYIMWSITITHYQSAATNRRSAS